MADDAGRAAGPVGNGRVGEFEAHDRAESRVAHPLHRGMITEPRGELPGRRLSLAEPQRKCPRAAQREKAFEHPGRGPVQAPRGTQPRQLVCVGGHRRAEQQV